MLKITHLIIRLLPTIILTSLLVIGWLTTVHAEGPSGQSHSHATGHSVVTEHEAEQQTNALMGLAKRYQKAAKTDRQALLEQMIEVVEQRSHNMATLVKSNPGAVLRLAIPAKVADQLPAAVHSYLESQQTVEGQLEVLYEDYEHHSILRHTLITDFNERIPLHFKGHGPKLTSGKKVRVKGVEVVTDDAMSVEMAVEPDQDLMVLELGDEGSVTGGPAQLSNTFGEQQTLVLLVNFQDLQTEPYTLAEAHSLVFETTNDFYLENSDNRTWLSGQTYGWFRLPINSTASSSELADAADTAAAAAGIDLTAYKRKIYIFPRVSSYGWSGLGTVGGNPSRSWINGRMTLQVVGHELGHNFGLYHSGSLECGDEILSPEGQVSVYGDTLDIMANKSAGHFNAFQKERLGWLDAAQGEIEVTQTEGTFTVDTLETARSATPQALRVLKDVDPATGEKTWFYIEYRQDIGFDNFLTHYNNILNGLVVHMANVSDPGSSVLLDMTPNSDPYYDWWDPALEFGQTFTDPQSGLTITSGSGNGSTATVSVSFGQSSCVRSAPTLTSTPDQSEWVAPGTPVIYTVTVTNNDSTECATSDFNLTANVPTGWTATIDSASLVLAAGQSTSATVEIISSSSAADGFYPVDITVQDSNGSGYDATQTVNYVVSTPVVENQPPVATADQVTITTKTAVTIAVTGNDFDPDGDAVSILSVTQGTKGTVTLNADNTVTYIPAKKFKTSDRFSYTISDGLASATTEVTITLSQSTDDTSDSTDKTPPAKGRKK